MKKTILLLTLLLHFFLNANADGWIQTNGPFGADVMAMATGPDQKIYAGTFEGGGVYRSMYMTLRQVFILSGFPTS
jgi:hypothetical protein